MGYTPSDETRAIEMMVQRYGGLVAAARAIGINKGYLSAVLHGRRRASNAMRCALGLAPRTVPVVPCPHCGKPPLRKRCACRDAARPQRRRVPPPLVRLVAGLLASGHLVIGVRRDY